MTRPFAKGYLPDPLGHKRTSFAHLAARLNAATPPSASMKSSVPSVLDQGPTSSCVGHATAIGWFLALVFASLRQQELSVPSGQRLSFVTPRLHAKWDWIPSPAEIYRNGRSIDRSSLHLHTPLTDEGAEPNQAFRAINEFGIRSMKGPTSDGRNSDAELSTINDEPKLGDLEEEALLIPLGEYGITSTGAARIQALRLALCSNKPVCVALAGGSDAFENYTGGVLPALKSPLDHYVLLIGYSTDAKGKTVFEGLNSWSTSWGEGGYFRLSEEAAQELGDLVAIDARSR